MSDDLIVRETDSMDPVKEWLLTLSVGEKVTMAAPDGNGNAMYQVTQKSAGQVTLHRVA